MICLLDNSEHKDREALHKYLRLVRVKQEDYYRQYFPRHDLFTGEPIPFKSAEHYLSVSFVNKFNIKKFIKQYPEKAKAWAIEWLKNRKEEKNLVYAPTHTELRSLMCPTVRYYDSIGGYNNICRELGYKIRFDGKLEFKPLEKSSVVIQDNREQKPLVLKHPIIVKKLDVADYGMDGTNVVIERKDLSDFVNTLSKKKNDGRNNTKRGIERFRAELERAKKNNLYVIMLVESEIADALSFNFQPQMRFTKATPDFIFKNLRDLLTEYAEYFQVLFVKGRFEASEIVIKLFEAGQSVKKVDVQYCYEEGLLTCGSTQKIAQPL